MEEFILDRTLDPALDEFGLDAPARDRSAGKPITESGFRMIDPACGSGALCSGRPSSYWQKQGTGGKIRDLVQKTPDCIHGVDVNPYAVAIARFRLPLMAMKVCGVQRSITPPDSTSTWPAVIHFCTHRCGRPTSFRLGTVS
ncbi:MAG: hypothetical protein R3C02_07810 [Planctomycetaceae bacterium]